jgi:hypothetical protein
LIQVVVDASQVAEHQQTLARDTLCARCGIALARGREPHARLKLRYRL